VSIGFALLLPADVPRGRPGPVGTDVPRAALTRLRKAGSTSLAAASFSLHPEALNCPLYTCNNVSISAFVFQVGCAAALHAFLVPWYAVLAANGTN